MLTLTRLMKEMNMGLYSDIFQNANDQIKEAEKRLCSLNEEYSRLKWWQFIRITKLSAQISEVSNEVFRLKCLRSDLWR